MTQKELIRQKIERQRNFIDSLTEETCKENTDSFTCDLDENNRKTRDAEVILNGHGLLVDVTKWADGYKLKIRIYDDN